MNSNQLLVEQDQSDADLVAASLTGDRDAFGRIVARHQGLVCSLAYSGIGNLAQSEDLAQETFVTAWRKLPDLREPQKLRPWLCGIVRNLVNELRRKEQHEPIDAARPLESANATIASEPSPPMLAIRQEEQAILWREIEQIPENYREPLVLFYRQNQSVQDVAAALELSEEAVRQRLSRGRKLLHERMLAFVEETLERTKPGAAFTVNVMSAVSSLAAAGKVATISATAAKGASAGKVTSIIGNAGTLVGPVIAVLASWIWTVSEMRKSRSISKSKFDFNAVPSEPSETQREELRQKIKARNRAINKRAIAAGGAYIAVAGSLILAIHFDVNRSLFILALSLISIMLMISAWIWWLPLHKESWQIARVHFRLAWWDPKAVARREAAMARREAEWAKTKTEIWSLPQLALLLVITGVWALYGTSRPTLYNLLLAAAVLLFYTLRFKRNHPDQRIVSSDRPVSLPAADRDRAFFEYRSRFSLLGLPLLHINYSRTNPGYPTLRRAKGWIAIGTSASGVIAIGLVAEGVVSIGIISVGFLSFGALGSIGLLAIGLVSVGLCGAMGGLAISYWAVGGIAVGWQALGGCALAWRAAHGWLAVARDMAVGKIAFASHVNDLTAFTFVAGHGFGAQTNSILLQTFAAFWVPIFLNVWVANLFLSKWPKSRPHEEVAV